MDYSTSSNKTNFTEIEDLSNSELSERFYSLQKQYDNLSTSYEAIKQELHETRRNYQTALDVQGHLNAELENIQAEEAKRREELTSRITLLQEQVTTLREERAETAEQHASEVKDLEGLIRRLKEENAIAVSRKSPERDTSELDEIRVALSTATSDAASTKAALEEALHETASWRLKVGELMTEVGELKVAAEIRREELKAAGEREASALADLAETRALLHRIDSQDLQPHAAKGNSIFAEVEDKRQEMAKNLIKMKQTNSRLRRDLAIKQAEVDALLHEKQTIWEKQVGDAADHDRELIESYEERITQLEGACEKQRRELTRWFRQQEAVEPGWLPAVLEHLRRECESLRAEVLSSGAAQLANAAQVRELRRKLAQLTAGASRPGQSTARSPVGDAAELVERAPPAPPAPPTARLQRPATHDSRKKVSFT